MTPFRRAREAAIDLRRSVLGALADRPMRSGDVIATVAAEGAEDFEIKPVPPGDELLGSSDALLMRVRRLILVRDDASSAEQAFLAAHEFGHWKLHPKEHDGCGHVIDAALRAAGDESAGTQKVEAYGVRERTELQANLFGRELLLPRSLARALFLAGKSASVIARELDLPMELVRQQLLDVLLLPSMEAPTEAPDAHVVPTQEQRAAAQSTAAVSLVTAGPGTGKTTTLLLRVQRLLERGAKPSEILILTFANRAARELADRMQVLGIGDAHEMWIGTFHAFGLEFLRKNHERFGLTPRFGVADKMAQIALLEPHIYQLGLTAFNPLGDPLDWLNQTVNIIQRAKDELVNAQEFARAVEKDAADTPGDVLAQQRDIARLFVCYEQKLRERGNLVDMGDLVMTPALALEKDYTAYTSSVGRFKHVLVDEYQDVNRASARLVKALEKPADSLWVVGDARQAIYRFRGASMRNILGFGQDFPKFQPFALNENRRSHTEIVRIFEQTGKASNPLQEALPLEDVMSVRGASGVLPVHVRCPSDSVVLGELVAHAKRLRPEVPCRKQVVLASTHDTCGAAADALNAAGVPALHLGDIFQRPEVRDVLSLLLLFIDRSGSALVRVSGMPGLAWPAGDVEQLLAWLRDERPVPLSWLRAPPEGLSAAAAPVLQRYREVFDGLKATDSPWDVACALLLDRTDFLRPLLAGNTMPDITRRLALWQLLYHLRAPDGSSKFQTVGGFMSGLRKRLRIGDDRELRIPPPEADALDAVAVMTIHGSKGLEFEAVHLVDIDAWHFRASADSALMPTSLLASVTSRDVSEPDAEAANKLYVALSRAKKHLILYEDMSRYKAQCVEAISEAEPLLHVVEGKHALPAAPPVLATRPHWTPTGPVELNALQSFYICPRRFYYDTVRGLSPSAGLHPAAVVESAVMRDLFAQHGAATGQPSGELKRALAQLGAEYRESLPHLQAYADQLLSAGRRWIGADRTTMAPPIDIACNGLPVRVSAHRIEKAESVVTLHFVRTRPQSHAKGQQQALRWMLHHLAKRRSNLSLSARIHVLSTGETVVVGPRFDSWMDQAADDLRAGVDAARPNRWNCPKCRHFLYCPA